MNTANKPLPVKTAIAAGRFLLNKAFAIIALGLGVYFYNQIPQGPDAETVPFAEVLYSAILVGTVLVVAPFARLLVFPEVSEYAESQRLRSDVTHNSTITPALVHYWYATGLCYLICIVCVGTITK
jgi:hypothetical protein